MLSALVSFEAGLEDEVAVLLLAILGVAATGVLRAIGGVSWRVAAMVGAGAVAATILALVAYWFVESGECWQENPQPPRPSSWRSSPLGEFCFEEWSPAAIGGYLILLLPAVAVTAGALLRTKGYARAGLLAYATVVGIPAIPSLYVQSLPY